MCLNLPYFLRYINRFQDAVSANSFFIMPATVADATAVRNGSVPPLRGASLCAWGRSLCWQGSALWPVLTVCPSRRFHSLVIDVTMALDTLSLPVLEPLTPTRLQDVTVLALSCLYAGEWISSSSSEFFALLYYLCVGGSARK